MERRKSRRIDARKIPIELRTCDLCLENRGVDIDVTIENVNNRGMGLQTGGDLAPEYTPVRGDRVFLCGCIFDRLLGFLSSQKATVTWCRLPSFGVEFDSPIDMPDEELERMAKRHG